MHWSDNYLHLRYDAEQFDCAALVEKVRNEVFNHPVCLPSERPTTSVPRALMLRREMPNYVVPTQEPQDGDVVLLVVRGRLQHIGLFCLIDGKPWVVHNQEGFGVRRFPLRDLGKYGYKIEGYYRWI